MIIQTRCLHRGPIIGHTRCKHCQGRTLLALYDCKELGQCTLATKVDNAHCCNGCPSYQPSPTTPSPEKNDPQFSTILKAPSMTPYLSKLKWAYGITTVTDRFHTTLPRTIVSLRTAGFDRPRLFADACSHPQAIRLESETGLQVTNRGERVKTAGNWHLAMLELFIRQPACDRYAIFQDDLVACKNLRQYLDGIPYEDKTYWNLFCFLENDDLLAGKPQGFHDGCNLMPGLPLGSDQGGRGAVALVFNREAVCTLLASNHFARRPMDANRGWRKVDGGIVEAMNLAGWREKVHYPSLVQHTGEQSSMGNQPHPTSRCFVGEEQDARELASR